MITPDSHEATRELTTSPKALLPHAASPLRSTGSDSLSQGVSDLDWNSIENQLEFAGGPLVPLAVGRNLRTGETTSNRSVLDSRGRQDPDLLQILAVAAPRRLAALCETFMISH